MTFSEAAWLGELIARQDDRVNSWPVKIRSGCYYARVVSPAAEADFIVGSWSGWKLVRDAYLLEWVEL